VLIHDTLTMGDARGREHPDLQKTTPMAQTNAFSHSR
jgi:hypothetical protein